MKSILLSLLLLTPVMLTSPAFAKGTPPTAEQQAAFLKQCLKVAPEAQTLCTCKADAAMTLVDSEFMNVIIASMSGKPLDAKNFVPYNDYIARSNKVCKPQY